MLRFTLIFSILLISFSTKAQNAEQKLSDIDIKQIPKGTVFIFNKDVYVPANTRNVTLFFVDETVSFGELQVEPKTEAMTIEKGTEVVVFRMDTIRLKDYFGYATKQRIFFENGNIKSMIITCSELKYTLADFDNHKHTDFVFKVRPKKVEKPEEEENSGDK